MVKKPPANAPARDRILIPGLGRSPGAESGNQPQCSCLGNPMDSGAWPATVYGVTKSRIQLSTRFRKHSVAYGFMEILLSVIPEHFNEVLQFGGIL